jgi:phage shock protein E
MMILTIIVIALIGAIIASSALKKRKLGTMLSNTSEKPLILDVRTQQEYNSGHYKSARNIPHDQIERHIQELEQWKNSPVIVYCHAGSRAAFAERVLKAHGFCKVVNGGGYAAMMRNAQ